MPDTDEQVLERFLEHRRQRDAAGTLYRSYLRWSGRALEIPLSVVVGLGLGILVERRFGVAPFGTWAGLSFGTAAAIRAMLRLVRAYHRENPDDDAPRPAPGSDP